MIGMQLLKKYKYDLGVTAVAGVLGAAAGVLAHGRLKAYTPQVSMAAPAVFAIAVLLVLTIICTVPHAAKAKVAIRLLVNIAVLALVAPAAFMKVETILAPYEWFRGAQPSQVAAWIASDRDQQRLAAWSRLMTMPRADKEAVARSLAPLLIGADDPARHSAELTLQVPLRQFSLTALTVLTNDLKAYLTAKAHQLPPSTEAERAGAFAEAFVRNNVGSIHKALDKDKRAFLPAGGLEALFLALAAEPTIGPIYLRELVTHGDEVEKPLAQAVVHLAAIHIPTT